MQETRYLLLTIEGSSFLLHGSASMAIVKRANLTAEADPNSVIGAWKADKSGRWPTYVVDKDFRRSRRDDWQQAVFLFATPQPVGLAVDDVQMLAGDEINPEPFTPLSLPVPGPGLLFNSAWVDPEQNRVILVLNSQGTAAYLQGLQ